MFSLFCLICLMTFALGRDSFFLESTSYPSYKVGTHVSFRVASLGTGVLGFLHAGAR